MEAIIKSPRMTRSFALFVSLGLLLFAVALNLTAAERRDRWRLISGGNPAFVGIAEGITITVRCEKNGASPVGEVGPWVVWTFPLGVTVTPLTVGVRKFKAKDGKTVLDLGGNSMVGISIHSSHAGRASLSARLLTFTPDSISNIDSSIGFDSASLKLNFDFLLEEEFELANEAVRRFGINPNSQDLRFGDYDGDGRRELLVIKSRSLQKKEGLSTYPLYQLASEFYWLRKGSEKTFVQQEVFKSLYSGNYGPDVTSWILPAGSGNPFLFILEDSGDSKVVAHVFRLVGVKIVEIGRFPFRTECMHCGIEMQSWVRLVPNFDGFEVLREVRRFCPGGWEGGEFGDGTGGMGLCGEYFRTVWEVGSPGELIPGTMEPVDAFEAFEVLKVHPRLTDREYLLASQWHDDMLAEYQLALGDSKTRLAGREKLLVLLKAGFRGGQMKHAEEQAIHDLKRGLDELDDEALLRRLTSFIQFKKSLAESRMK